MARTIGEDDMNGQAGKGDRYRPVDQSKWDAGWDAAFGPTRKARTMAHTGAITTSDQGQLDALRLVRNERDRQDQKWGTIDKFDDRNPDRWLAILMEEVGEVAEAILEKRNKDAITEAVQVAAVAVAMVESLTRNPLEDR